MSELDGRFCPICDIWFEVSRPRSRQSCCSPPCASQYLEEMNAAICEGLTDHECAELRADIANYQQQRREEQMR